MSKTLPFDKDRFERWQQRLMKPSIIHQIPAMLVLECEQVVISYYGSFWRAALHLLAYGMRGLFWHHYWGLVYRICDKVGWTNVRQIEGLPKGHGQRHSSECKYLNCDNIDCVKSGIPKWYRRLTGMMRMEDE